MQRFGRGEIKTHMTGVEVLKKNWKGVVESLLFEDSGDRDLNDLKK
jgi:tRNA(Glu) U13 pseudouridine synthase TruD